MRAPWPALGLAVASALGCATARPAGTETGPPTFEILETMPAGEPLPAAAILPLDAARLVMITLDRASEPVVLARRGTDRFEATVALDDGAQRTQFVRPGDDGGVLLTAVLDHDEEALTHFDPPLALVGHALAPGVEHRTASSMVVLDANDPRRTRERGRATSVMTYADDQRIRTPLGTFTAARVVTRFHADLRLVDVKTETVVWIVPDLGMVARHRTETLRVLGLPARPTRQRLVLVPSSARTALRADTRFRTAAPE